MKRCVNEYYNEAKKYLNNNTINSYITRNYFVNKYSWAVPSFKCLYKIKKLNIPILELGAGSGYWSYLLSQIDITVVAYDMHYHKFSHRWFNVQYGSIEKIKNYSNCALLLCWPPISNFAYDALRNYTKCKGHILIYIGEEMGGCTANDKFFQYIKKFWKLQEKLDIPRWNLTHDAMFIYTRK